MSHLHPVNPETSCYIYAGNDRIHRRSQDDRFLHLLCAKQPTYTALVIRSYTDTFRYHSGYLFYRKDMGVFHDLRKVPVEIRKYTHVFPVEEESAVRSEEHPPHLND